MFDAPPFAADALLPFPQSAPYAHAAKSCGADVFVADLGCGSAQVVQRGQVRLISRGPIWLGAPVAEAKVRALRRLARWPGVTLVTPEQDLCGLGLIPLVTPMHHAIWDLAGDLRAGLDRKWRNHLSAAERAGVQLQRGDHACLDLLLPHEASLRRRRRYVGHPAMFHLGLPPEDLRIWEWWHKGALAAAMVFVRHGTSASYHLAWGNDDARKAAVHQIMLWQAANALCQEGVRWLDLGSVNDEDAPGLARFKLGTGAALHRLGHTLLVLPG